MRSSTPRNTSGRELSSAVSRGEALLCGLGLVATLSMAACDRPSAQADVRYLVTSSAIDVGVGPGLCLAVDPRDPHGVWWWQPGASGCASRSTGPTVFHADRAVVSRSGQPEVTAVSFRMGTMSVTRPFMDIRLAIEDSRMRSLDTGAAVALQRRNDLDVPGQPPRGTKPM
jgi:hypothetical protein